MALFTIYKRPSSVFRILTLLCAAGALIVFFQYHVSVPASTNRYLRRSEHAAHVGHLSPTDRIPSNTTDINGANNDLLVYPRADDDLPEWYKTAIGKGCNYLAKLIDPNAQQSQQTDYSQLSTYGWKRTGTKQFALQPQVKVPVTLPINQGGLGAPEPNDDPGYDPTWVMWDQNIEVDVGSQVYNPSRAYYQSVYYPSHGILISANSLSPAASIARNPGRFKGGPLVPYAAWSDIQFLEWQNLCSLANTKVSSLQYIFRSNIINTATQQVILQTLTDNNINTGPPKWPGKEFAIDSQEGRALMGTANGNGVAWILFSHREQLGWKSIKSVVVFDDVIADNKRADYLGNKGQPSMLFNVEDYTPPADAAARKHKRNPAAMVDRRRDSWAELDIEVMM